MSASTAGYSFSKASPLVNELSQMTITNDYVNELSQMIIRLLHDRSLLQKSPTKETIFHMTTLADICLHRGVLFLKGQPASEWAITNDYATDFCDLLLCVSFVGLFCKRDLSCRSLLIVATPSPLKSSCGISQKWVLESFYIAHSVAGWPLRKNTPHSRQICAKVVGYKIFDCGIEVDKNQKWAL